MPFDLGALRAGFPILQRTIHGKPLVYLDNAASSLKPEMVIEEEARYYREISANVHRGQHALAHEGSALYEAARAVIARFLGAASEHDIVFVPNTTSALNLVAQGMQLDRDCTVISTHHEHHSTLLPWLGRAKLAYFPCSPFEPIDPQALRRFAQDLPGRERVLVLAHASNVTGLIQPIREICQVARELGLTSVIDAAQSAPHLALDVSDLGCDFLAFSGHKALGPMGVGVLYGRGERLRRLTVNSWGGGVVQHVSSHDFELRRVPARFEPGTPNVAGALALARAAQLLQELGPPAIAAHHQHLRDRMLAELEGVPGIRLLAATPRDSLPIVSFALDGPGLDVNQLCVALSDQHGIMTRAGKHCAHPLFAALGISGALRASAYVYNTPSDIQDFGNAVRELIGAFA